MKLEQMLNLPHVRQYVLSEADKQLVVKIDHSTAEAHTFIFKIPSQTHISGTTTRLYGEAVELMQKEASAIKKPVKWVVRTENPAMRQWLTSSAGGLSIVGSWDEGSFFTENAAVAVKYIHKDRV